MRCIERSCLDALSVFASCPEMVELSELISPVFLDHTVLFPDLTNVPDQNYALKAGRRPQNGPALWIKRCQPVFPPGNVKFHDSLDQDELLVRLLELGNGESFFVVVI